MTFTTLTFVLFLWLVFALYWAIGRRSAQNAILVVASYAFYAWWDWRFCSLMLISSFIDYGASLGLVRTERPVARRILLALSVAANLGMLGFFKYFNFFAENLVAAGATVGLHVDPFTLKVILPVGISFYTFQTMSYTFDIYHGALRPTTSLVDYMAYVSFFPQLVAGPIERGSHLLPQFLEERRFDRAKAVDGCRQALWGFFKKIAIADNLGLIADAAYASPEGKTGPQLALATVAFAFQIYCDFSAYSDIAIGTARLFGVDLMRNFAYPYFSQTMGEFWRRWHISLSTWFRDYLYIPLGGSRTGGWRRALNVMLTFVVSGLWHGASWNFVVWGGLNGLAILPTVFGFREGGLRVTDAPGGERTVAPLGVIYRIGRTFLLTCVAWVFFRARTLSEAWSILGRIAADGLDPAAYAAALAFPEKMRETSLYALAALVAVEWLQRSHPHPLHIERWPRPLRWAVYTAIIWFTLYLCPEATGQFIYFQF